MIHLVIKGTLEDKLYDYLETNDEFKLGEEYRSLMKKDETIKEAFEKTYKLKPDAPSDVIEYYPQWIEENVSREYYRRHWDQIKIE